MDARSAIGRTRDGVAIAAELRREFDNAFQARFGSQPVGDPVLQTLFLAFAQQIHRIYQEAEDVFPLSVLEDLIRGLGLPSRRAQPAQTVVQFSGVTERERISVETALVGYAPSGEHLVFSPDHPIELQQAVLRFAAIWDTGRLQVVKGASLPDGSPLAQHRVPLSLRRAAPTLWLAIESDGAHLGGLGVHLESGAPASPLSEALERSPWMLLSEQGHVRDEGVLWPSPGRGGVRLLSWFAGDEGASGLAGSGDTTAGLARSLEMGEGPVGREVFVLPAVPPSRRWRSRPPPELVSALPQLLPAEHVGALDRPLAWIQIGLPAGTRNASADLRGVALNCTTCSNVEILNERVIFDRTGTVAALHPESDHRFLLDVMSVTGEGGSRYAEMSELEHGADIGRFRAQAGRLEFRPARNASGRLDGYAMVRLLMCDGEVANGIGIDGIRRIASPLANVAAQVCNLTPTRGGADPLRYSDARLRFAEQIRTRERVVTAADYDIACRSFDARITGVRASGASSVEGGVLVPVDEVVVTAAPSRFADPDAGLARLRDELTRHLASRIALGRRVRVRVEPREEG